MSVHHSRSGRTLLFQNMRQIVALAAPMLVGLFAFTAFGALDTAMVGRYSAIDLAALSLGASVNISVYMGLATILYALQPVVGRLFGNSNQREIGEQVREAAWLSLVLMVIGVLVLRHPQLILQMADTSHAVSKRALEYLRVLSFAFPASICFALFGTLSASVSKPHYSTFIWLSALAFKLPLNAWFIYGGFGLTGLGGIGAALATTCVLWLAVLICVALLRWHPFYRSFGIFKRLSRPRWRLQFALLRLGVPMALSSLIEVTSYTLMTLLVARFNTTMLAGHQIAVNLGAVLYMTPLAIGIATSTLVSQKIGARSLTDARAVSSAGIGLAALCATLFAIFVTVARHAIVRLYTSNPDIAAVAEPLVQIVAFYHIADAIQVCTAYTLRGYNVIVLPTFIYSGALYGVGLCGGYAAAFKVLHLMPAGLTGARGFWCASTVGLALAATCLVFLWNRVSTAALDANA
jgi:MATE family multidrug resistance protein